ncbi:MAG: hypothetical protein SNJ68_07845 [Cyanobacteriota bacterium]
MTEPDSSPMPSNRMPADPRYLTLQAGIRRHQFRQDTLIEILHRSAYAPPLQLRRAP